MAGINQYAKGPSLRFSNNYYIPEIPTPNFELWANALNNQQKKFDSFKSLSNIPIDALPGEDERYAGDLRKQVSSGIDDVVNVFKLGDIKAGNRALRDKASEISQMVLPGGDIHELGQRKKSFGEYKKGIDDMLAKGEISKLEYPGYINKAIKEYNQLNDDGFGGLRGGRSLGLNPAQQRVDEHKHAQEFLKTKASDQRFSSGIRLGPGGQYYIQKDKLESKDYNELRRELSSSFTSRASQTGQLEALRYSLGNGSDEDIKKYNKSKAKVEKSLDKYDNLNNLIGSDLSNEDNIKAVQKELKTLGYNPGKADGIIGNKTKGAMAQAQADLRGSQAQLSSFGEEYSDKMINDYISQTFEPYAASASFDKQDRTYHNLNNAWDAELARRSLKEDPVDRNIVTSSKTAVLPTKNKQLDKLKLENGEIKPHKRFKVIGKKNVVTPAPGFTGTTALPVYDTDDVSQEETRVLEQIKNQFGFSSDAEAIEVYNQAVENSGKTTVSYHNYDKKADIEASRFRLFKDKTPKVLNIDPTKPVFVISEGNSAIPVTNKELSNLVSDDVELGVAGEIHPFNPLTTTDGKHISSGDVINTIDNSGKPMQIIVGNRSVEEEDYLSIAGEIQTLYEKMEPGSAVWNLGKNANGEEQGAIEVKFEPFINNKGEFDGKITIPEIGTIEMDQFEDLLMQENIYKTIKLNSQEDGRQ